METLVNKLEVAPERSMLPIIITGDRVLIERDVDAISRHEDEAGRLVASAGTFENSSLAKPLNAEKLYASGKIMSIGKGYPEYPVPDEYKVGMQVSYYHQSAQPFPVASKEYDLIRASDIFAIL